MRVHFSVAGWEDYTYWRNNDTALFKRFNELIEDIRRSPFKGIGKPEPFKGKLYADVWSRRLNAEHRLQYSVEGKGEKQAVIVLSGRYHY